MAGHMIIAMSAAVLVDSSEPPLFPEKYTVAGAILTDGFTEIETFFAVYDAVSGRSRIDFRSGDTKTLHLPYRAYKVYTNYSNGREECHSLETEEYKPQGVIPDLRDFKFTGIESCDLKSTSGWCEPEVHHIRAPPATRRSDCHRYEKSEKKDGKNFTHAFWALRKPGFDTLPVRYFTPDAELVYGEFIPGMASGRALDIKRIINETCTPHTPESGLSEYHLFNPMKEFVDQDVTYLEDHFVAFEQQVPVRYTSDTQRVERKKRFVEATHYANSNNRKKLSFVMGVNPLVVDGHQNEPEPFYCGIRRSLFLTVTIILIVLIIGFAYGRNYGTV